MRCSVKGCPFEDERDGMCRRHWNDANPVGRYDGIVIPIAEKPKPTDRLTRIPAMRGAKKSPSPYKTRATNHVRTQYQNEHISKLRDWSPK